MMRAYQTMSGAWRIRDSRSNWRWRGAHWWSPVDWWRILRAKRSYG